eukprot:3524628-Amphidinium_carterae.1
MPEMPNLTESLVQGGFLAAALCQHSQCALGAREGHKPRLTLSEQTLVSQTFGAELLDHADVLNLAWVVRPALLAGMLAAFEA